MRVLRVARFSARKARTQTLNQMRSLISTAPESIRDELRHLRAGPMVDCAAAYRPGTKRDLVSLTKFSLRLLARRAVALEAEVAELDTLLAPLVAAPHVTPTTVAAATVGDMPAVPAIQDPPPSPAEQPAQSTTTMPAPAPVIVTTTTAPPAGSFMKLSC